MKNQIYINLTLKRTTKNSLSRAGQPRIPKFLDRHSTNKSCIGVTLHGHTTGLSRFG